MYKIDHNQFYVGERYIIDADSQLVVVFERNLGLLNTYIEKLEISRGQQVQQTNQRRVNLQTKKASIKQAVFAKYKVVSTPEIETMYAVVSRLNTRASISKAFGELLPLIK